jgi:flagellar basal-body rod modification protein FlgD
MEAAIPGLTDTGTGTGSNTSTTAGGVPNQSFPNLSPAQSAANAKAAGATLASSSNSNALTGAAGGALDKNAFLKLLVQEMTNQDPLKPADNTQFVAQLAQFSTLEQMQNMNTGMVNLQAAFQEGQARGLLGVPIVAVKSDTGEQVSGTVDQVILGTTTGSDGSLVPTVQVDVNGTPVNISDIVSVGPGATSTGGGTSSTAGGSLPGTLVPPSSGSGH